MVEKITKVSNPLTIIAIFAALTEVMGTIVVTINKSAQTDLLIYFLVGFPTLLVLLFFLTLNFNPKVLYSPSDFIDETNYLKVMKVNENYDSMNDQLESLENKIASTLSEKSNLKIDELRTSLTQTINSIKQVNTENKRILFDTYLTKEKRLEIENEILNYLSSKEDPQTADEISVALRIEIDSIRKLLYPMWADKRIIQTVKNTAKAYSRT